MITKIYKQQSPICYLYAIAYALQDKYNVIPTDSEIEQYAKKALASKGRTGKQVIKLPELVYYMSRESFCGYKIAEHKTVHRALRSKKAKLSTSALHDAYSAGYALIYGIKIRQGGFRNRIDEWGVYQPPKDTKRIDGHAVYGLGMGSTLEFVNSHGIDFGKDGYFWLCERNFDEIEYVEAIKFIPKYS